MEKMKIEIWSDIACPYCHIGKRKLENALAKFPYAGEVELVWYSYELNPDLPKKSWQQPYYEHLAAISGCTVGEAKASLEGLVDLAKETGLDYHFEKMILANTSDALRLVKLAKKHKLADEAEEVLFDAYFVQGEDISDAATLLRLGKSIGLDESEINDLLAGDEFLVDIEADIRYSEDVLNLQYIPFYLFNGKNVIQGSLTEEEYTEVLQKSHTDWKQNGTSQGAIGERRKGRVCSPDGTCSL